MAVRPANPVPRRRAGRRVAVVAVVGMAGLSVPGSAAASPGEPAAPATCPPDAASTPEEQSGSLSSVLLPDVVGDGGRPLPVWLSDAGPTSPGGAAHRPLPMWLLSPGPVAPGDSQEKSPTGCPPLDPVAADPGALDPGALDPGALDQWPPPPGMTADLVSPHRGARQGFETIGPADTPGGPEPAEPPDTPGGPEPVQPPGPSLAPPGGDHVATTLDGGQQEQPLSVGASVPPETMPRDVKAPEAALAAAGVLVAEEDQPDPDEVNSLIDQIESQLGTGSPAGGATTSGATGQGQPKAAPSVAGGQREGGATTPAVQPARGGSSPSGASSAPPSGVSVSSGATLNASESERAGAAVDGAGGGLAQTGLRLRELLLAAAVCIGSGRVAMRLSRPSPPLRT